MRARTIASVIVLLLGPVASAQCPDEHLAVKESRSTTLPATRTAFLTQALSSGYTLVLGRSAFDRSLAAVLEGTANLERARHVLDEVLSQADPPVDTATFEQALQGRARRGFEVIDGVRVSQVDEERHAAAHLLKLAIQRAFVAGSASLRRSDGAQVDELTIELLVGTSDPDEGDVVTVLRWVDRTTRVLDYCFEPFSVREQWVGPRQN